MCHRGALERDGLFHGWLTLPRRPTRPDFVWCQPRGTSEPSRGGDGRPGAPRRSSLSLCARGEPSAWACACPRSCLCPSLMVVAQDTLGTQCVDTTQPGLGSLALWSLVSRRHRTGPSRVRGQCRRCVGPPVTVRRPRREIEARRVLEGGTWGSKETSVSKHHHWERAKCARMCMCMSV